MKKIAILFFLLLTQISFSQSHNSADIFGNPLGWFWGDTITASTPIAPTSNIYYVSNTGSDGNSGLTASDPFQTLAKVNSLTIVAGSTILLKGGDTFTGGLSYTYTHDDTVNAITYSSYGTGKAKILLGVSDSIAINVRFTKHIKVNISNIVVEGIYDPVTETGGHASSRGIYVWNFALVSPLTANLISQVNISNCEITNIRSPIGIVSGDYGKTITSHIDSNLIYNTGGGIGMSFNWHSNSRVYANTLYNIYGYSANDYDYGIVFSLCKGVTVERNLIYNIGYNSAVSGIGIQLGACKNISMRYNEIYGIQTTTLTDCEAINFENGTDSCLAEFNYIHDTEGMGFLISGNSSETSINNNYKTYATERGSIDSGSADYNVVRFNVMKNLGNAGVSGFMGIRIASGIIKPDIYGRNNQAYNNTIVFTSKRSSYGFAIAGHHDSTKIFNNIVIADSMTFLYTDSISTKRYAYVDNNMYWDREKSYFNFTLTTPSTQYTNFNTWNTATGWESKKLNYNPLLANALSTIGDTLNNPFLIEYMTKYIPVDGSLAKGTGVTLASYTRDAPTTDIRGIPLSGNMGIGAFIDSSSSYPYQAETKRWVGRMDTIQTAEQMQLKDSLIAFLKTDTILSKWDIAYFYANLDSTSAKLNLLKDTFNVTTAGSPTFTSNQGYTGNGASAYLNANWIPSTNGVNYVLDSASVFAYVRTAVTENKHVLGTGGAGVSFIRLNPRNTANQIESRLNENGAGTTSVTSSTGLYSMIRSGSASYKVYKHDTLKNTIPNASTSLSGFPLYSLARNGAGTSTEWSTRELSFLAGGGKFSDYTQSVITRRIGWYLNRLGAFVGLPSYPFLELPLNADTGVVIPPSFDWSDVGANYYVIQVDDDIAFGSVDYADSTSSSNITGSGALSDNTVYYWRVMGVNANGRGDWSPSYSFRTASFGIGALVAPLKDLTAIRAHIGSGAGYLLRPYNPPQYTFAGDSLRMYMQIADSSKVRISKSVDGINWTANGREISVPSPFADSLIESTIRENGSATHWWGLRHYYDTNTVSLGNKSYFYKIQNSTDDGVTWTGTPDTLSDGSKWFGEDHTSFYHPDSNKYYLLLRRESSQFTLNRKISLVKTSDFVTFTPRTLIVPADSTNYDNVNSKDYRKTFYFGSMFTTGAGEYWILATIYKIDADEDETGQALIDTAGTDNCTWTELLFSEDGDNWKRTNDTNAFIPLNNGYRQIYGLPTVFGDSLFIYTFEAKERHILAESDHFDIWRYRISLADLRAYKP